MGLSVIPIGASKVPLGSWKENMSEVIEPGNNFYAAKGVGLVCGKVNGNLEVIDIDVKHDPSGSIMERYMETIDMEIGDRLVAQKTKNGGYHLIYRAPNIAGNKKLAKSKETGEAIIETRGEGGYIAIAPTPGYELDRDLSEIPTLTADERNHLISQAMSFNEVEEKVHYSENCFEAYNERGDVLKLLQGYGWVIKKDNGDKVLLKRPGDTDSLWSADYTRSKNWFTVFSTSTAFESLKAYKPANVFAILECDGDLKLTAKKLKGLGFGSEGGMNRSPLPSVSPTSAPTPKEVEVPENPIASDEELEGYVEKVRSGDLEMGLKTGFEELDKHFVFKLNNFIICNGHDNVGKSVFIWFLAIMSAKLHNWRWIIYAAENRVGFVYVKLLEFFAVKKVQEMKPEELAEAKKFIKKHFTILNNYEIYTYKQLLVIGEKLCEESEYQGFFIDPYNSLDVDMGEFNRQSTHDYHYKATNEFRQFSKKYCGIWLSCHAVTYALRQKDHDGNPAAPQKADTEGGGKFSNRADDFITLHRKVQDSEKYRIMEVHIRKVKETETGGRPTHMDHPILFEMLTNNAGYIVFDNMNPRQKTETDMPF